MSQKVIDTAQSGMQQILAGIALMRAGYCQVMSVQDGAVKAAKGAPNIEKEVHGIFNDMECGLAGRIEDVAETEKIIHGRMNDLVEILDGPRPRLGK